MISRRGLIGIAGAGAFVATGTFIATRSAPSARVFDQRAPDFVVSLLGRGGGARLSDYRGNVLLLNFWATWCAPCRVEMPWLVRTSQHYGSAGLSVLGVNMDDGDMPNVERFAQTLGVTYPIAQSNDAIVGAYGGVRFLPQSVLIGRQSQIVQRSLGMPSINAFEAAIIRALSQT
jgi:cytochrome c biogenesis protein CcmG/thiol:disulfide interchange protein DsbE